MRPLRLVAALALMLVSSSAAAAQLVTTLDVGAAAVTYDDAYSMRSMSLTPTLRWEHARGSLLASGTFSRFETGMLSSGGWLTASVLTSATARVRGELSTSLSGSAHEDLTRNGLYLGHARVHLLDEAHGLWLGGGAGQTWDGSTWRAVRSAEAGAWWRVDALLFTGSVEPASIGDTALTDIDIAARWTRGTLEFGAGVGTRVGGSVESSSWAALNGTWWLGRVLALSATGGSYPADLVQGIPGGRYLSVGLRIASRPPLVALPRVNGRRIAPELARPVAGRIDARRAPRGDLVVRLEAPGARRVELMGDFTEWKIVVLAPARDGWWHLTLPVAAGTHRFNVRIDGGTWGVPRGVTTITDDFEGVVGILTVQ